MSPLGRARGQRYGTTSDGTLALAHSDVQGSVNSDQETPPASRLPSTRRRTSSWLRHGPQVGRCPPSTGQRPLAASGGTDDRREVRGGDKRDGLHGRTSDRPGRSTHHCCLSSASLGRCCHTCKSRARPPRPSRCRTPAPPWPASLARSEAWLAASMVGPSQPGHLVTLPRPIPTLAPPRRQGKERHEAPARRAVDDVIGLDTRPDGPHVAVVSALTCGACRRTNSPSATMPSDTGG